MLIHFLLTESHTDPQTHTHTHRATAKIKSRVMNNKADFSTRRTAFKSDQVITKALLYNLLQSCIFWKTI